MGRVLESGSNIGVWSACMSLISRCTSMQQLKPIHSIFISHGLHHNNYAISKLISFCALSGSLNYASLLFHQTQSPNSFMYNTLIRAYSSSSQPHRAFYYFHLMLKNATTLVIPDYHTFPFLLIACSNVSSLPSGQQFHCWMFKNGLGSSDSHIQTALLRFYMECSSLLDARKIFDEISHRDAFQWNVLINGYLRRGVASDAVNLFHDMLLSDVEPDEYCVTTGLTACAHSGALQQGIWIHDFITRRDGFVKDVFLGTALVDMYAKCGCIDRAVRVFEGMSKRNAFSWASMIGGFALHGFAKEAIHSLERMIKEDRLRPDGVVVLAVLIACTHAGLKEEGKFLLQNMEALYGITPKHEHYGCTVDLLCRAGQLDEALVLIQRMPMKPLASVWGSLLSACKTQGNVELAELAAKELEQLEHDNGIEDDGVYVQLSNIYLNAHRNDDARMVRKVMGDKGITKMPGCSVIEVNGEVNEFLAGEAIHPLGDDIHAMLNFLSLEIAYHSLH